MVKKIDYYLQGLSIRDHFETWYTIDKINQAVVKDLLEKPDDYPTLRSIGLNDDMIRRYCKQAASRFQAVNEKMIALKRYPLFSDSEDTYGSSLEYCDLMQKREEEELIQFFGKTLSEYVPAVYEPDVKHTPEEDIDSE